MTLTRRLGHAYEDGVYHPSGYERPNPLTISQYVMKGKTGKPSYMNRTVLMTFFGMYKNVYKTIALAVNKAVFLLAAP